MAVWISSLGRVALAIACACTFAASAPADSKKSSDDGAEPAKPLRGVIHYRRVGGYAYGAGTAKARDWRFVSPAPGSAISSYRQSPGGPFDTGFFFDSGVGSWVGGQAPYQH